MAAARFAWLDDPDALDRRAVELGLQPWAQAKAQGIAYGRWVVSVIGAARRAGEVPTSEATPRSLRRPFWWQRDD
jgi:hypothetical protein